MIDILLLSTIGILILSLIVDVWRLNQLRIYIKQNKFILAEMEMKRKQIFELSILFEKIGDINDTIKDNSA